MIGWMLITITIFRTDLGFPPGSTGMVIHKVFETKEQCEEEKAAFGPPRSGQRHECREVK